MRVSPFGALTRCFSAGDSVAVPEGSAILRGATLEERHRCPLVSSNSNTYEIVDDQQIYLKIGGDAEGRVNLRQASQIDAFFEQTGKENLVLEITSLSTNIWFPLLRRALKRFSSVYAVYSEPMNYSRDPTVIAVKALYDLSERITGIKPIPGTSIISTDFDDDYVFVPILGFEGARFSHILENVQPPKDSTVPIVGLPGFRAEYATKTLLANKGPLVDSGGYRNIRYAAANCPFSICEELDGIREDSDPDFLKIAPIGTKPAALGAALFFERSNAKVELIYDHPVKKTGRTQGIGNSYLYHLSPFMK